MVQNIFIRKGLRFECVSCGDCCRSHGEMVYIYLTDQDVQAIAAYLALLPQSFRGKYCQEDIDGQLHLKNLNGACDFLDAEGRCTIYRVRPKQCAAWPFLRENLNPDAWNGPVKAVCKGINKGPLKSAEAIEAIAKDRDNWYGYSLLNIFDK